MCTAQIGHDGTKGRFARLDVSRATVERRQNFQRQLLRQGVDGDNHVGASPRISRWPAQTGRKGVKANAFQQNLVDTEAEIGRPEFVKGLPHPRIGRHEFVEGHIIAVGPNRTVVRINVNNVTVDSSRIQGFKGIAQGVGRRAVTAARIAHQNLNGTDICIIRRGRSSSSQ